MKHEDYLSFTYTLIQGYTHLSSGTTVTYIAHYMINIYMDSVIHLSTTLRKKL